jgi:hypothetical protein
MSEIPSPPVAKSEYGRSISLRDDLYRYFFYDWLFRDADSGSEGERAAALRHNRDQAKWLPVYIWRWVVAGAVILALEALSEHVVGNAVLSAVLLVVLVFVVLFLLVSVVCWAFLRSGRPGRD